METLINALSALPVSTAVLDESGTILAVNDTWKEFGQRNGLCIPNWGVGTNYLRYSGGEGSHASRFVRDLKDLLAGRLDLLTAIYPCHSSSQKRWFTVVGVPFPPDKPTGAVLFHVNFTDMLPLPTEARRRRQTGPANGQGIRSQQTRSGGQVEAISDAIERSVADTLSGQILAMVNAGASSPKQAALLGGDQRPMKTGALRADDRDDAEAGVLVSTARPSVQQGTAANPEFDEIVARAQLTKRQMDVLRLLGEGKTNQEIAESLFRSPHTIKLHVSAILERLNLKSRTQAALLASKL
jgi:DNA-binding CsgD family transcriptional regulator